MKHKKQVEITDMQSNLTGRQIGGHLAKEKNLAKDPNFYRKLGQKGGLAPRTQPRGFAAMTREQVQEAGRKGGSAKKGKKYPKEDGLSTSLKLNSYEREQLHKLNLELQAEAKAEG